MNGGHLLLGSREYIDKLKRVSIQAGEREALHTIMADVDLYGGDLNTGEDGNALRLYQYVSSLIGRLGQVEQDVHYFRNKLNRVPKSLDELLAYNATVPFQQRWRLLSVRRSLYHMQDTDGIYNVKFVSCDGFCEAVYNKDRILLTEENDPVNMGTFNYAPGICQFNAHRTYDVAPYLIWGNTAASPQKGTAAIKFGVSQAKWQYRRNSSRVTAYRKCMMKLPADKIIR